MRCEQARQLFDAYLDGALSATQATELGAHRVQCSQCRRALALMEVTGHIIASDADPVVIGEGFENRLLACMERPQARWTRRMRRGLYIGGPFAAAAVIALAFLGVFDRHESLVAGKKVISDLEPPVLEEGDWIDLDIMTASVEDVDDAATEELDRFGRTLQETGEAKRENVEALLQNLDLTIVQWLDILEEAEETSPVEDHFPGADAADPSRFTDEATSPDIDDADNR